MTVYRTMLGIVLMPAPHVAKIFEHLFELMCGTGICVFVQSSFKCLRICHSVSVFQPHIKRSKLSNCLKEKRLYGNLKVKALNIEIWPVCVTVFKCVAKSLFKYLSVCGAGIRVSARP